jgi:uncharacterized protein (TIGR04255 family)
MPKKLPNPLGGPPPAEISLPRAPLARVVAQVRFPGLLKIENRDVVSAFQEAIRREYPLFEQASSQQIQVEIGPGGPSVKQVPGSLWRFQDARKNWRLSLSSDSMSLEVESYTSRGDFLARWNSLLQAAEAAFDPQIVLRIGMRYIDRVTDAPLQTIDQMVHTDVLGFAKPPIRAHIRHALSEATLEIEEGEMLLRWGIMPPNSTIDPGVLVPIPGLSWLLDIDVFSGEQRPFVSDALSAAFLALAQRAYAVFRHMTTDEFLKAYGGAV